MIMKNNLTIVMYHYVRDTQKSKIKNLKFLDIKDFCNQLDYLKQNYNIISGEEFVSYLTDAESVLPNKPCLLTFDDGYKDHIEYALPELLKRKISGCFFPVTDTLYNDKLLEVNAIQCILSIIDKERPLKILEKELINIGFSSERLVSLFKENNFKSKYDNSHIVLFKRLLQYVLPIEVRKKIINFFYDTYVQIPQNELHKDFYMNIKDLQTLKDNGMTIGNHTHTHQWLKHLTKSDQIYEITRSMDILKKYHLISDKWLMCYPYGSFDDRTIDILKSNGCVLGLTISSGINEIKKNDFNFRLKRIDTKEVNKL